jgi:uncharacterized protein (UPF0216 family)
MTEKDSERKADEEEAEQTESEESSEEEEELSAEQLQAKLDEQKKHIARLNRESAERRKKLEEFEKAEEKRKQAEMSEAEKANARVKELETANQTLEQQIRTLTLQRDFEAQVRDANLTFRNSKAAKIAFKALVEDVMEEGETEVSEAHIKQLVKDLDYLFGKPETTTTGNDGSKKGKNNSAVASKETIAKKRFDL